MENKTHNITKKESSYFLDPINDHEYTLIFLHGLGDNAGSFANIFS